MTRRLGLGPFSRPEISTALRDRERRFRSEANLASLTLRSSNSIASAVPIPYAFHFLLLHTKSNNMCIGLSIQCGWEKFYDKIPKPEVCNSLSVCLFPLHPPIPELWQLQSLLPHSFQASGSRNTLRQRRDDTTLMVLLEEPLDGEPRKRVGNKLPRGNPRSIAGRERGLLRRAVPFWNHFAAVLTAQCIQFELVRRGLHFRPQSCLCCLRIPGTRGCSFFSKEYAKA